MSFALKPFFNLIISLHLFFFLIFISYYIISTDECRDNTVTILTILLFLLSLSAVLNFLVTAYRMFVIPLQKNSQNFASLSSTINLNHTFT